MPVKAVAYIRVSTKEQDEMVQARAIKEYAEKNDIEIVKWYVDKGESGAKPFTERPSASRLLSELPETRPEALVAWSLDRIGRSMLDIVETVMKLERSGLRVITVKEEWLRTLDPNIRNLILSVLAFVADFERRRMRERQQEAWRQGKQKGRPPKITLEEVERYINKYPDLPISALTVVINADRRRHRKPPVSYHTVREKLKQLGYTRKFIKQVLEGRGGEK